MTGSSGINITIAGRTFFVSCIESEQDNLRNAAQFLDKELSSIQSSNRSLNFEKCVVMVALNMSAVLLAQNKTTDESKQQGEHILKLVEKIDSTLNECL